MNDKEINKLIRENGAFEITGDTVMKLRFMATIKEKNRINIELAEARICIKGYEIMKSEFLSQGKENTELKAELEDVSKIKNQISEMYEKETNINRELTKELENLKKAFIITDNVLFIEKTKVTKLKQELENNNLLQKAALFLISKREKENANLNRANDRLNDDLENLKEAYGGENAKSKKEKEDWKDMCFKNREIIREVETKNKNWQDICDGYIIMCENKDKKIKVLDKAFKAVCKDIFCDNCPICDKVTGKCKDAPNANCPETIEAYYLNKVYKK